MKALFDLGAGDGRILVEAARKFGARPQGLRSTQSEFTNQGAIEMLLVSRRRLFNADFMTVDLSSANVIAMYLSEYAVTCEACSEAGKRELRVGAGWYH